MKLSPFRATDVLTLDEAACLLSDVPIQAVEARSLDEGSRYSFERWREVIVHALWENELSPRPIMALVYQVPDEDVSIEAVTIREQPLHHDYECTHYTQVWCGYLSKEALWTRRRVRFDLGKEELKAWLARRGFDESELPGALRSPGSTLNQGEALNPKKENTLLRVIAALVAINYGKREVIEPFKLAEEMLDDCQKQGDKAPAGRTTLGELFKQLPPVQKANLD